MKRIVLIGVLGLLLLTGIILGVYAYNQNAQSNSDWWEYMEVMHNSMVGSVADPQVRAEMNAIHEGCERIHGFDDE